MKKKATKKPLKRKQKPRTKSTRGSASGLRKRPVQKKKKASKKKLKMRRSSGRAAGVIPSLKKRYSDAKERLGRFYRENEDAIVAATKIALGVLGTGALGYGAYRALENPDVQRYMDSAKRLANSAAARAVVFGATARNANHALPVESKAEFRRQRKQVQARVIENVAEMAEEFLEQIGRTNGSDKLPQLHALIEKQRQRLRDLGNNLPKDLQFRRQEIDARLLMLL